MKPHMLEVSAGQSVPSLNSRLIRLKEVMHRVGLGRSTIYRWMDEGKFPKPHSIGKYSVRWLESDIDDWITSKICTDDHQNVASSFMEKSASDYKNR